MPVFIALCLAVSSAFAEEVNPEVPFVEPAVVSKPIYIHVSSGAAGSISHDARANSIGAGLGLSSGYFFSESFGVGAFYKNFLTFGSTYGLDLTLFGAAAYGVEVNWFPSGNRRKTGITVGLQAGEVSVHGLGLFLAAIPSSVSKYSNFGFGPSVGVLFGADSDFRYGLELSQLLVLGGEASYVSVSSTSQTTSVPLFGITSLSFVFSFRI